MPKFMRSHDDAGETASVLDDGHTVHLVAKAQRSEDGKQKRKKHQSTTVKRQRTKKKKTLPKALRTQALTALTSNFGLVGLVQYA